MTILLPEQIGESTTMDSEIHSNAVSNKDVSTHWWSLH